LIAIQGNFNVCNQLNVLAHAVPMANGCDTLKPALASWRLEARFITEPESRMAVNRSE
jgi:hypothetical protein